MQLIIDPEFNALIPPLASEEFAQLEENILGFSGNSKDGMEDLSLIPSCMGNLWWHASLLNLGDCTQIYTKRPIALSRLAKSEIMEPVRNRRIRMRAGLCDPVALDYFDEIELKHNGYSDTLYFIEAMGTGFVKVGICTETPTCRLNTLQIGNPFELRLIASRPGSRLEEVEIHRRLESSRVRGEWFAWTSELGSILGGLGYERSRQA